MQTVELSERTQQLILVVLVLVAATVVGVGVSINASLKWFGLSLIILVVLASALLVLLNTVFVIDLLVFLVPWQIYLSNWPGSTYTFRLSDILLVWTVLYTIITSPRTLKQLGSIWLFPLVLFCGLAIVIGISRGDLYAAGKFTLDWWVSISFYWLLQAWGSRLNWPKLIRVFLFSYALQAGLGIVQMIIADPVVIFAILKTPFASWFFDPDLISVRVNNENLNFIWQGRVYAFGTYLGASGLGITLAIASLVAWAKVVDVKIKRLNRSTEFYLGLLLSGVSILAMKRSGWLALLGGILLIVLLSLHFRKLNGQKIILFALFGVMVGGLAYAQRDNLMSRIIDQIGWQYGREQTWPAYLNLVVYKPIGYGPNYPLGSQAIGLPGFFDYSMGPDNTYLHLALTSGILGLGAFLWLIFYAVWQLWQTRRFGNEYEIIAILSGLAAFLIGGMFVISLGDLQNNGVLFLLLAWAYKRVTLGRVVALHA